MNNRKILHFSISEVRESVYTKNKIIENTIFMVPEEPPRFVHNNCIVTIEKSDNSYIINRVNDHIRVAQYPVTLTPYEFMCDVSDTKNIHNFNESNKSISTYLDCVSPLYYIVNSLARSGVHPTSCDVTIIEIVAVLNISDREDIFRLTMSNDIKSQYITISLTSSTDRYSVSILRSTLKDVCRRNQNVTCSSFTNVVLSENGTSPISIYTKVILSSLLETLGNDKYTCTNRHIVLPPKP